MKHFIALVIAAFLVGLAIYVLAYFVFNVSHAAAFDNAVSLGITGLVVELLRPYLTRKHLAWKAHQDNRIRRNLKHVKGKEEQSTEP